jgi:hypothetical protein
MEEEEVSAVLVRSGRRSTVSGGDQARGAAEG